MILNNSSIKRMDIETLCEKINLQPEVKSHILAFSREYDFTRVDEYLKNFQSYKKMDESLNALRIALGEDRNNIKMLSCMLKASADIYDIYQRKNISDDIYFDTMKCYTRFINETFKVTGRMYFNREWWTTRQAGGHLFRIGELEYNMNSDDTKVKIGIHVPSDADLSPNAVDDSIQKAISFFSKYYPEIAEPTFYCHSWLMDRQLQKMLNENSNIINFQKRFKLINKGDASLDFLGWVYYTDTNDYEKLPENTSLQRNIKKHILSGGVIRTSYGELKKQI